MRSIIFAAYLSISEPVYNMPKDFYV